MSHPVTAPPASHRPDHSAQCLTASRTDAAAQAACRVILAELVAALAVVSRLTLMHLVAGWAGAPPHTVAALDVRIIHPGTWTELLAAHPAVLLAVFPAGMLAALVGYRRPVRRCRRFECPAGLAGSHRRRRDAPTLATATWDPLPDGCWGTTSGLEYAHLGTYLYLRDAAEAEALACRPRWMWQWAYAPGPAGQRTLAERLGLTPPTAAAPVGGGR